MTSWQLHGDFCFSVSLSWYPGSEREIVLFHIFEFIWFFIELVGGDFLFRYYFKTFGMFSKLVLVKHVYTLGLYTTRKILKLQLIRLETTCWREFKKGLCHKACEQKGISL